MFYIYILMAILALMIVPCLCNRKGVIIITFHGSVYSLNLRHVQPLAGQLPGYLGGIVGTVKDGVAVNPRG